MKFKLKFNNGAFFVSEEYKKYKTLGFTVIENKDSYEGKYVVMACKEGVEINTLEELITFNKKYGVICFDGETIEIIRE